MTTVHECGTCYACCVWLGITELRKWPGQTCKHLDGRDPRARCSIYEKRPDACSSYKCVWLQAYDLPEDLRPDNSGFIATLYGNGKCTVNIFDRTKAGTIEEPDARITRFVRLIMASKDLGLCDVVLLDNKTQDIIALRFGKVYKGKLHPQKHFEDLTYEIYDPPYGEYRVLEIC